MARVITKSETKAKGSPESHVDAEICGTSWKDNNPPLIGTDLRIRANTGITDYSNAAGLALAASVHHTALKAERVQHHGNSAPGRAIRRALTDFANATGWLRGVEQAKARAAEQEASDLPTLARVRRDDGSIGDVDNTLTNLQAVLRDDPTINLSFNEWDLKVYNDDKEIDFNTWHAFLALRLEQAYGWKTTFKRDTIDSHTVLVAGDKTLHPLKDYVENLQWDGVPRADMWLQRAVYGGVDLTGMCFSSETERDEFREEMFTTDEFKLTGVYGRCLLLAMMARLFEPGSDCKVDTILVLAGSQGIGKQKIWKALAGPENYGGTTMSGNRAESSMQMLHAWIYEDQEMASGSFSKEEAKKAFLSDCVDLIRLPYKRGAQRVARHCVMVGSTNNADTLLKDPTGSRRYNVVKVPRYPHLPADHIDQPTIDVDWVAVNRDQILAEACHLYRKGEKWFFTRKNPLFSLRAKVNRTRFQSDDPYDAHARVVYSRNGGGKENKFLALQFAQDLDADHRPKDLVNTRFGSKLRGALKKAGFKPCRTKKGRFWYKPLAPGVIPITGAKKNGLGVPTSEAGEKFGTWGRE